MNKIISGIVSSMVIFTCLLIPSNAFASGKQSLDNTENFKVVYDANAKIEQLEPVEVDLSKSINQSFPNESFTIEHEIKENEHVQLKSANARSSIDGSVSDYLLEASDAKIYSITVNPSILLQARLKQPNNSNLDYDLSLASH